MPRSPLFRSAAALSLAGLLMTPVAGCSTHSADSYGRDEMGKAIAVSHGTVVSVREVKVEGTKGGVGAATGAAIGGVGGYQVGGNDAVHIIGAIGGAVIGGLIGLAAERGLTTDTAEEVVVQEDSGATRVYVQKMDDPNALRQGDRVLILRGEKIRVVKDAANTPAPATLPAAPPASSGEAAPDGWEAPAAGADAYAPPPAVRDGRL
jgi:outer membrane lipoprotein SlyB